MTETIGKSSVEHIVTLSSASAGGDPSNLIAQLHLVAEQAVRDCGVPFTFLRPGGYMSNAMDWVDSIKNEGVVRAPFGHVRRPDIHPKDIASVATSSLTGSGHEGNTYPLSGPAALTTAEQVEILARVLGRDIRFEDVPEEAYTQMMSQWMPIEVVTAVVDLTRQAGAKDPAELVWSTVQDVTGRPPLTFEQWAVENVHHFM